ncbi:hypothetical protein WOLCODRAFT_143274 [Wolfiporia cocos MD-104 SS10]|uniref:Uncharacterized protein n=1 Tax=Wolfiporia cocos (strain MD-104) TaxID=742152 RepID=A0A2H3JF79_WOLCO|nr:hypothetical protein WOLCODRAFT_143274 [Wolfiporia cocos MD-104 SS10]
MSTNDPAGNSNGTSDSSQNDGVQDADVIGPLTRMVSNTVNKVFTERGYHPDTLEQLRTVQEWNARLRDENAKLFNDNRKLTYLMAMQNEQLSKVQLAAAIPQNATPAIVIEQQQQMQAIERNYNEVQHSLQLARQEINHLRAELARLTHPSQAASKPPTDGGPTASGSQQRPNVHPNLSTVAPPGFPMPVSVPVRHFANRLPLSSFNTAVARHAFGQGYAPAGPSQSRLMQPPYGAYMAPVMPATQLVGPYKLEQPQGQGFPMYAETPKTLVSRREQHQGRMVETIDLTMDMDEETEEKPVVQRTPQVPSAPQAAQQAPSEPGPQVEKPAPAEPEPKVEETQEAEVSGAVAEALSHGALMELDLEVPMDGSADVEEDFIQDCVDATFIEDEGEAGSNKLWCKMCRSRHAAGVTTQAPEPFVNATVQTLVEHCEREHPRGWECLQEDVKRQREEAE